MHLLAYSLAVTVVGAHAPASSCPRSRHFPRGPAQDFKNVFGPNQRPRYLRFSATAKSAHAGTRVLIASEYFLANSGENGPASG
eukprot:5502127-Pyramimonas_sp.AAC.1